MHHLRDLPLSPYKIIDILSDVKLGRELRSQKYEELKSAVRKEALRELSRENDRFSRHNEYIPREAMGYGSSTGPTGNLNSRI